MTRNTISCFNIVRGRGEQFYHKVLIFVATVLSKIKVSHKGQNKPKISRATLAPVSKIEGPLIFLVDRFGFPNIIYTSGIEMSKHFQGPFGPLVLTLCKPSSNFKGIWPEDPSCFTPLHASKRGCAQSKTEKKNGMKRHVISGPNIVQLMLILSDKVAFTS